MSEFFSVAKLLRAWKAKWITMAGRLALVKIVLSAMPTYQMMSILHPKWLDKMIDKLKRAFLWAGSDEVSGGKCLGKLTLVCRPLELGSLGIPDMQLQSRALRMR